MKWCRVYHPGIRQEGTIPETAVEVHRAQGWWRVGEYVDQQDQATAAPGEYVDLDAEPTPEPAPEPTPAKTKEKN